MIRGQGLGYMSDSKAKSQEQPHKSIDSSVADMTAVVQAARDVNCPLYLGTVALNLLLSVETKGLSGSSEDVVAAFWDGYLSPQRATSDK